MEGKGILEGMRKRKRPMIFYSGPVRRGKEELFSSTAIFPLPHVSDDRVVIGAVSFDPYYLKEKLFPKVIEEVLAQKLYDQGGNSSHWR